MPSEAQILVFSDSPAEGEKIAETIRKISNRAARAVIDPATALKMIGADGEEIVFAHSQAGTTAATRFLNEVWTRNPKTTRFLVGDSAPDSDALIKCAFGPHQFIPGPIDPEKLKAALSRADAIKRFVRNEKIRELVSRMRTLPNRPALSIEIMRELRSAKASAGVVGELVSKDVAIATKLIQMANSAFYSSEQQVCSPLEAILRIGLETTAALVLSIESFSQLDKLKPLYFSMDRVWKHSQSVAELAREVSQRMGCDAETSANVYTAGLLHDIGKLAFALNFDEDYEKVLKDAEKKGLPVHQAEEEFFGATHAETGAYLLALWGMPLPLVEAVAGHHSSIDKLSAESPAVIALRLADQLVNAPDRRTEILAEYQSDVRIWARLEKCKGFLETSKDRPAKKREAKAPAPQSNIDRERAETSNNIQRRRLTFYLAFSASVALAGVVAFYSWPRIVPLSNPPARLHAKAFETQVPSKAEVAEVADPLADSGTTMQKPLVLDRPFTLDQPPESPRDQPPVPDHPFPFDHLFPTEESFILELSPEPEQGQTITAPETDSAVRLTSHESDDPN